jgi:hypothetical protein
MSWKLITGSLLCLALLAGCATGASDNITGADDSGAAPATNVLSPDPGNREVCDADLAQDAVGQKVTPSLVEEYRKKARAKQARALRPRDVITMEYNPQRLNLRVDEQDTVISVNCS